MSICDDCKKVTYTPIHYGLGNVRCLNCSKIFDSTWRENKRVAEAKRRAAHVCYETEDVCTECCEHYERDHYICLDCGDEQDPGEAIDYAQDRLEDC